MKISKVTNINVTAGGTYTVNMFDPNELIYVYGAATLGSNLVITHNAAPMGMKNGLMFHIIYDGTGITFGTKTCTIFGETMPTDLRNQKVFISVYSDGSSYKVYFNADFNIIKSLFSNYDLIYDWSTNSAATINTGGAQLLETINFANPILTSGDNFTLKIHGAVTGATSKTIAVSFTDNIIVPTSLFSASTSVASYFELEIKFIATDVNLQYFKRQTKFTTSGVAPVLNSIIYTGAPAINFDEPIFTFYIYGTEGTPSGNQIVLNSITIEKNNKG